MNATATQPRLKSRYNNTIKAQLANELGITATASSDFHGPPHKTFSRFGAYQTYDLGEPAVPPKP